MLEHSIFLFVQVQFEADIPTRYNVLFFIKTHISFTQFDRINSKIPFQFQHGKRKINKQKCFKVSQNFFSIRLFVAMQTISYNILWSSQWILVIFFATNKHRGIILLMTILACHNTNYRSYCNDNIKKVHIAIKHLSV